MQSTLLTTLLLGFALGMEHALDADHLVAVSTLLGQSRHPLRAARVGALWGLGHTTTLFLTGLIVIAFKLTIPTQLALSMEFLVGVLLFGLGAQILWKHHRKRIHTHDHAHPSEISGHRLVGSSLGKSRCVIFDLDLVREMTISASRLTVISA